MWTLNSYASLLGRFQPYDLQVNQFVDGLAGKLMPEPKYCELAHNKL